MQIEIHEHNVNDFHKVALVITESPFDLLVLFTEAGEGSAGYRHLLGRYVVWPIVCFGSGGNINVGVSIVGCVYVVVLAEALDDVQVGAGRLHEAVLQQPAIRLRLRVSLPQHIFQGGLEVTNPRQHRQLKQDTQVLITDRITHHECKLYYKRSNKLSDIIPPYDVVYFVSVINL